MLPYYHMISDFHFGLREGLLSLKRWLRNHASDAFPDEQVRNVALD